ncbi:UNVERIFIED_CONTAM: hypothetical protein GTU68_048063 [Idotea baltica]|nr:hypothetical protein [Idotea baltica]
MEKGQQSLSNAELIAILLRAGTLEISAVDLAKVILQSVDNDLDKLARLTIDDLCQFKGIGEAKAITILASLELGRRRTVENPQKLTKIKSSQDIYNLFQFQLGDLSVEEFWIVLLNRSHTVIETICISKGGVSGTVVDAKLVFKHGLQKLASSIVLVHNHPSGNREPSHADRELTKKIVAAGKLMDIQVVDHLIICLQSYYSFADEGIMPS